MTHAGQYCCAGGLPIAYANGGAPSAVWGWVVVATMTMTVALSMAEVRNHLARQKASQVECRIKQ